MRTGRGIRKRSYMNGSGSYKLSYSMRLKQLNWLLVQEMVNWGWEHGTYVGAMETSDRTQIFSLSRKRQQSSNSRQRDSNICFHQ